MNLVGILVCLGVCGVFFGGGGGVLLFWVFFLTFGPWTHKFGCWFVCLFIVEAGQHIN